MKIALGFMTDSWTVFAIAGVVMIGAATLNGDIRLQKHRRYRRHRR